MATGAKVSLKIDNGNSLFQYDSHPVNHANVHVQVDECTTISPLKTPPPKRVSVHTPKKVISRPSIPLMEVENLPGRRKISSKTPAAKATTGKCKECNIIYESKEDKAFRKKTGCRKTTWIGCDRPRCNFWAHASCAGLLLHPNKSIKDHSFLCMVHRKR